MTKEFYEPVELPTDQSVDSYAARVDYVDASLESHRTSEDPHSTLTSPSIFDFARIIGRTGFANLILLDSSGSQVTFSWFPTVQRVGFEGVADAWAFNVKLGGVADPELEDDAANRRYVDNSLGLRVYAGNEPPQGTPEHGALWVDEDDTPEPNFAGYRYLTTVKFESSGTFNKADYPDMRAVRVRVQGGGGGGQGNTPGYNNNGGPGGGGGCYAESFLLAHQLAPSEAVTVGAGGAGGFAAPGQWGETSSFGSLVEAGAGEGGGQWVANTYGGRGGYQGTGDLIIPGQPAEGVPDVSLYTAMYSAGTTGGGSHLGAGGYARPPRAANAPGGPGQGYGGGGGGGFRRNADVSGGDGAPGVVIVEVYV